MRHRPQVAAAASLPPRRSSDPVQGRRARCSAPPPSSKGRLPSLPRGHPRRLGDSGRSCSVRAPGVLARWLQDSARVRAPAQSLIDALLRDDLAGAAAVGILGGPDPGRTLR